MTNSWTDIKNTDLVVIMGGNAAEAHPCGFKWVTEAKQNRGAKLMKADRDANFIEKNADGKTVNRWLSTGMLAASASSNEVGYLTHKTMRSLGMLAFDNQARV